MSLLPKSSFSSSSSSSSLLVAGHSSPSFCSQPFAGLSETTVRRGFSATPVGVTQSPQLAGETDSEVKDPSVIFNVIWSKIVQELGQENMVFPREIIWLMGAPGSGKGTNTPYLQKIRGLTRPPIVMSDLLNTDEAKALKAQGTMVSDAMVIEVLFRELLKPDSLSGVIVDGFPRTIVQADCIKLLHDRMMELRQNYFNHPDLGDRFRRPKFRLVVLFVDENESVKRQLYRGKMAKEHNEKVKETGQGKLMEERSTDFSEEAARSRYRIFKDHYETLVSLSKHFAFKVINANNSFDRVRTDLEENFQFQSSLELGEETFNLISPLPLASDLKRHSRQELIRRLDHYQTRNQALFSNVITLIQEQFLPILTMHSNSGYCVVRSSNAVFENPSARWMVIDVLTERGFHVTSDFKKTVQPVSFEPATGRIITEESVLHIFYIYYHKTELRVTSD